MTRGFLPEGRVCICLATGKEQDMHGKGLHLIVFILIMGPLIWVSQRMGWGDTGTFVCVVAGIVLGWLLLKSGTTVRQKMQRTFGGSQKHAAPDFLFGPANPTIRHQEMRQMQQQVGTRTGQWNAPALQPQLPHPGKRPERYEPPRPSLFTTITQQPSAAPQPSLPTMNAFSLPQPAPPRTPAPPQGPLLTLGPGAQMLVQTSLTGMLVLDAQQRRPVAPVFLEEWIKLGLGLLVIDTHGTYTGYLAHLSPSFGFLAGSQEGQERLTSVQQSRYMPLVTTTEAQHVGQSIVDEGLQVIFNVASYGDKGQMGTCLLALLAGIERKAQEFVGTKPCVVLVTDAEPFAPDDEAACLIPVQGVAQEVYEILMNLLEYAGQQLKHLGLCLTVPSLDRLEEDVLTTSRLWVVNCLAQEEIPRLNEYLELSEEEVEELLDSNTMLFDTNSDGNPVFVRFRKAAIQLGKKVRTLPRRQTDMLAEEDEETGGGPGPTVKD